MLLVVVDASIPADPPVNQLSACHALLQATEPVANKFWGLPAYLAFGGLDLSENPGFMD